MQTALTRKRFMPLRSIRAGSLLLSLALTCSSLFQAHAQDATGSLEGRLTDKNGAPVVNASVQVKNLDTNAVRTQTSDSDGYYRVVQLEVGHYSLSVDAPGFARFSQSQASSLE
jgi:protocatechuate 3,4-dioxygenase beta subunit